MTRQETGCVLYNKTKFFCARVVWWSHFTIFISLTIQSSPSHTKFLVSYQWFSPLGLKIAVVTAPQTVDIVLSLHVYFKSTPLFSLVIALVTRVPDTLMFSTMMIHHETFPSKYFSTVCTSKAVVNRRKKYFTALLLLVYHVYLWIQQLQ